MITQDTMKKRGNKKHKKKTRGRKGYTAREKYSLTFLDPHRYMAFRYVGTFALTAAIGVATQQTMNLNSLFDPDRTGVGHQPYGYDQISALYNRYRVLKTRVKVTFGTCGSTLHVLTLPINGLLPVAITNQVTFETAAENPRAISKICGGSGAPTITMRKNIDLKNLNGVPAVEYHADDRFEAQVGASPIEVIVLVVAIYNPNGPTATQAIEIELIFETDMHDPISLAGS